MCNIVRKLGERQQFDPMIASQVAVHGKHTMDSDVMVKRPRVSYTNFGTSFARMVLYALRAQRSSGVLLIESQELRYFLSIEINTHRSVNNLMV